MLREFRFLRVFILMLLPVFVVSGCASSRTSAPAAKDAQAAVRLPEPVAGLNVFVTPELVPLPLTADKLFVAPDPLKANPFDEQASLEMQSRVRMYMMDLREHIHLPFRDDGLAVQSYVTGARYAWDELRRDRRNYRLSVWPTRSAVAGQEAAADLRFSLINESTGRVVWTRVLADPFRLTVERGYELSQPQRASMAMALADETLRALRQDGILPAAR